MDWISWLAYCVDYVKKIIIDFIYANEFMFKSIFYFLKNIVENQKVAICNFCTKMYNIYKEKQTEKSYEKLA